MKRLTILLLAALAAGLLAPATIRAAAPKPRPLYIVNGKVTDEIHSIPPEEIEHVEMLPADEETIARYGQQASNGVMLITLRYDQPALFPADTTFGNYIARQVRWEEDEPVARVVLRYTVNEDGSLRVDETLESTDSRLKRRVLKAVEEAPRWQPARKNGKPVASEGVLSIQLPEGRQMPHRVELVYR
ncbi:energy transducer TonB [uncultured Alistipes sp.]|uniref:energy transducer TonB n=1 Tax=uncultured Alistipes sp. TaxID=538949 RepID=UPI002803ACD6|nr:energy transducer TonB [uncultured Alistipes sp.]